MVAASQFLSLSITVESAGLIKPGFTPLIYSYSDVIPPSERVREYSTATIRTDMVADGFVASDPAFLAASAIASQDSKPDSVKVCFSSAALSDWDVDLTVLTAVEDEEITVTIWGENPASAGTMTSETYSRTVPAGSNLIAESNAVAALIAAGIWGVAVWITAVGDGVDTVNIRGQVAMANKILYLDEVANLSVDDVTAVRTGGIGTDLDSNILPVDSDWFYLVPADAGTLDALAASTWANATDGKAASIQSQDSDILAGTGLFADASALDHVWTIGTHSKRRLSLMPAAAVVGRFGSEIPGTTNWSNKSLRGVAASEYTTAEETAIFADGGNIYSGVSVAGTDITDGIYVFGYSLGVSRSFFDIYHLLWAMVVEAQVAIVAEQIASKKIPFSNKGLAQVQGVIKNALTTFEGEDAGLDVDSVFCNVPTFESLATADINNRILRGVTCGGRANGAILQVIASMNLSVSS
jgi:hypothetical protein